MEKLAIVTIRDITERKTRENELREAYKEVADKEKALRQTFQELSTAHETLKTTQNQLVQSEKLASVGHLAAGVAHEINNPVGFISSNMEILEQYIADYAKVLKMADHLKESVEQEDLAKAKSIVEEINKLKEEINLDYIIDDTNKLLQHNRNGIDRIQKIVTDLRTFSREDKNVMERVKIEEVIESILTIVQNEIKYKAKLEKNYGDTPLIECNPQRLGQVFINLLVNALHAIEGTGTITINTYKQDEFVCVDVRDTGKGIPPENLNKIFDPFFTTKPAGQGTGLGLSVSYEIIKKHSGRMTVRSTVGEGTTFTVMLPINKEKGKGLVNKENQVLFVDDEESIVDGIQRLFVKEHYGIIATTDIEHARKALAQEKIKIIVCDHRMPVMLGVKFLQEVKANHPDVIRILFTGYADFPMVEEAINQGEIYRFISKPWKTTELLATVRQAIAHYDLVEENKGLFAETKRRQDELEISNKKLVDMYKIQREFTSTVSHELRTPLASIKIAIDLVCKRMAGEINREQEEVLARAQKKRGASPATGHRHPGFEQDRVREDANGLQNPEHQRAIEEVIYAQQDVAKSRGLYLRAELDKDLSQVPFDKGRIIQVLNNLVSNAIKFTQHGGVTIKTENKSANNHIIVNVTDTGKGIAESDFPKLFQKFQQIESPEKVERRAKHGAWAGDLQGNRTAPRRENRGGINRGKRNDL